MTRVLVTGGGGFLGQAIVRQLTDRGYQVRILNRQAYPQLQALGIEALQGDITHFGTAKQACEGCDAVIHTAAKAGVWGPEAEYQAINVRGTQNVIRACQDLRIARLVHTSSPSVVFDGTDQQGINEDAPYPTRFQAAYPRTKAAAEQAVLAANTATLATVALRPHLIWGPGDPHLAPRLIERAKQNRLFLIDHGDNKVDTVFVDNAAYAHVRALEGLAPGQPIAGRAYFITNHEPWPLRRMINGILQAAGLPAVHRSVPRGLALAAAYSMTASYRLLRRRQEPPLTPFVVKQLATAHWFNPTRARDELGYEPQINMIQGMSRLKHFYQEGQQIPDLSATYKRLRAPQPTKS
jgi:nucleoside-diphosphate-sugar epimerase